MSAPLQTQITDLPPASVVNDTDYTIVRQGLADFKAQMSLIRDIDISALPVSQTPAASDLMMLNRAGQNYSIRFDRVGFVANTTMWFYQDTAPLGWQTLTTITDCLVAVKGGTNQYNTTGVRGNWMQPGHALSVQEMPAHAHLIPKTKDSTGSSNDLGPVRGKGTPGGDAVTLSTGGQGSTDTGGDGKPAIAHNHGNTWRPLAAVGVLGRKMS